MTEYSFDDVKERLEKYVLVGDSKEIAKGFIRGDIRRIFFSQLLEKKMLRCHEAFKFFVSRTQAIPMVEQLKYNGYIIELGLHFMLNPEWVESMPILNGFPVFKKVGEDE